MSGGDLPSRSRFWLRAWDNGANGINSHLLVGLWTSLGGSPLSSTTITSVDPLDGPLLSGPGFSGRWRYRSITPIQLNTATTYVIGMDSTPGNGYVGSAVNPGAAAQILVQSPARVNDASGLVFPNSSSSASGYGHFGPNFQFSVADLGGIPTGGSIIDVGIATEGGGSIVGGLLALENTGEAGTTLALSGISGLSGPFSIASGNSSASLLGDGVNGSGSDIENLLFEFDPTGLTPGTYTAPITVLSGNGNLSYTLSATVTAAAVPEPSTFALAVLGVLGLATLNWRFGRGCCERLPVPDGWSE